MSELDAIREAVVGLNEPAAVSLVKAALAQGLGSVDILDTVQTSMRTVGERYEQKEIFLSGLIMAGEIFRSVMTLVQQKWEHTLVGSGSGRVLLGTVAGDIHDIGKDMAALAFRTFGFTVEDLGVDVRAQTFLEAARSFKPDIVALSGLVSTAFTSMRETVNLLRSHAAELGQVPLFVIGGGTLDEHVARYVGTDLWTDDAMEGVRLCQRALETRSNQ